MKLLSPTPHKWLNEVTGLLLLSVGLFLWLSLVSYQAQDPSWNTSAGSARRLNLIGYVGSYLVDLLLQTFASNVELRRRQLGSQEQPSHREDTGQNRE